MKRCKSDEPWLVVGAGGFLGTRLTSRLLRNSPGPKLGFAVDLKKPHWLDDYPDFASGAFVEGDWRHIPLHYLESALREAPVWVICASVLPFRSRAFDHSANVQIAERVVALHRLQTQEGRKPFVIFISSSSVYGFSAGAPLDAHSPEAPVDSYGKSKLAAEDVYRQIPHESLAILRPRTVVGRERRGTISTLKSILTRGLPVPVPPRNVLLQLCHVEDLVSLIVHVGSSRIAGLWPAFSLAPKTLEDYVRQSSTTKGGQVLRIPSWTESILRLLIHLPRSPFTNWHIAGFFRSHFFDPEWLPEGFVPRYTSQEAFDESIE